MIFKASVKDDTGALQHIERDYPTKKQFIRDLRCNGFKVDNRKVLTKKSFDYIIENTNCTKWDWREYTDEQIANGVDGLTIYMSQEHKPRNRKECYEVRVNFFHEEPTVLHFRNSERTPFIEVGNVFTVEPMINVGKPGTKTLNDGWTAVTRDGSLSAQWEHTIVRTKDGVEILTLPR